MDSSNDSLEYSAGFLNARTRKTDSALDTAPVLRSTREGRKYYRWESYITVVAILFTAAAWCAVTWETLDILWQRMDARDAIGTIEQLVFIAIIQSLIYGNFLYQFARLGYLRRRMAHVPRSRNELESLYAGVAPSLAILVPSYKEEVSVVRKTLLSAALQDYPDRRVVLLVDNPPHSKDAGDRAALE